MINLLNEVKNHRFHLLTLFLSALGVCKAQYVLNGEAKETSIPEGSSKRVSSTLH